MNTLLRIGDTILPLEGQFDEGNETILSWRTKKFCRMHCQFNKFVYFSLQAIHKTRQCICQRTSYFHKHIGNQDIGSTENSEPYGKAMDMPNTTLFSQVHQDIGSNRKLWTICQGNGYNKDHLISQTHYDLGSNRKLWTICELQNPLKKQIAIHSAGRL